MYQCLNCKKEVSLLMTGAVRCPSCGSKVFTKTRDPVTKTLKAR